MYIKLSIPPLVGDITDISNTPVFAISTLFFTRFGADLFILILIRKTILSKALLTKRIIGYYSNIIFK